MNIFFEQAEGGPIGATKEIICFETSKLSVWDQLEHMALAPHTK
jgi:hypothetical protein